MYNDEILSPSNKNSRRESTSSIDEHQLIQLQNRIGRRRRSSSLIHSLAEKLSEKENSPPNSRRPSRPRLPSTKLSEREEENSRHSSPHSLKHSGRQRTRSVSRSSEKHSPKEHEKSPPNSAASRRRKSTSRKLFDDEDDVQQTLSSSPKITPRNRTHSSASLKHSPKETGRRGSSPPISVASSRRKSFTLTKLHEKKDEEIIPEKFASSTPKLSSRDKTHSLSQSSLKTSPKENRKSLTNSKSGSISLRASREQLHDKNVSSVRKDSSVDKEPTILPLTQRSRSMSAGTKPSERSQSRKSSKTIYQRPMSHIDLSNSVALRSATYQDWLQRKLQVDKRKRAVSAKQLKEQEEKQKEKDARKIDAVATYESWKRERDIKLKAKVKREKMKLEKKAINEKEDKEQKTRDAEKLFHVWKNEKDKKLREVHREMLRKKEEEREKEQEKKQKIKDADTIFKRWKENKDKEIVNVVRAIKTIHKERDNVIEVMQSEKDLKAAEAYDSWLKKKEVERFDSLNNSFNGNDMESKIPWLPPNKTTMSSKPTRMTKIRR